MKNKGKNKPIEIVNLIDNSADPPTLPLTRPNTRRSTVSAKSRSTQPKRGKHGGNRSKEEQDDADDEDVDDDDDESDEDENDGTENEDTEEELTGCV